MMVFYWGFILISTTADGNDPMDNEIIQGRHFRIGTIHAPPYIIIEHTGRNISHVNGFVHQIVSWLAEKHQFTFEYVGPPDGAYGAFVNGSWNGMVGMVIAGEIDIIAASLSVTYPRSQVVDFTFAFSEDPTSILIPYPQLDSTISGIVKPFQYEVWIGIILSMFIVALVLGWISRFEWRIHRQSFHGERGWLPHFWFLFRALANPNEVITFSLSTRLVVAAWCLIAVVFVNSYTSSLVSYLMAPKFLPVITTVKSLAESRDVQITVLKHTSVESILFEATSGVLAKLGAHLKAHPENQLPSLEHVEDVVYYQRKAFPHEETVLKVRIDNDFKVNKKCRLAIAKEPLFPDQHGFALHKGSALTDMFNYNWDYSITGEALSYLDRIAAQFRLSLYVLIRIKN
ncbi:glutamate receptor 1-like [Daphnia pulicaria]|uniref:glutamate receptor 1-like n=1 Tax=Daphnia pulicaria TaxID=35523 RepID=UPI001EEC1C64|nr:glutamate receptor 1-like [Daphnia pulicaria]